MSTVRKYIILDSGRSVEYILSTLVLTLEIIDYRDRRCYNYDTVHARTDIRLQNKILPDILFFHSQFKHQDMF